ncbi:ORF6N domain-containing protein [Lacticaseibacillus paracasei]|uniref:ORF6N domain-containing protein n=1 Tax=Lacticaseibacillus paracasei TaxID=1597 RepID=UPI001C44CBAF|nr:ORF6C domain-containing protein [Lacticaseibacillus paracasei]QXJ67490.1 ORF6C domain-containing protein [Lacticaseibacillus paracasei subsp. paracasei]
MNEPQPIEQNGQRVLTTEQLAELYGTTVGVVQMNFKRNSNKFIEGKHFFKLEGEQLRAFKNEPTNCGFVGKNASVLYLWTRRGAARHSKMLGTDQAWDMFDSLEENYFNPKARLIQTPEEKLALTMEVATRTVKRIEKLDGRVTDLEENVLLAPGEYNYISKQVNRAVTNYLDVHHCKLNAKQRSLFYRDINHGLNDYIGVKTRTQLRKKDFDKADDFIKDWMPSTVTLMKVREISLFEGQQQEVI